MIKKELTKVLYVPSLNIPVCYWRIENYAEQMVKMKHRVKVNVEYFDDLIDINMAWDDACIGKGSLSSKIQRKLENAFKYFDIIIFQRIQNMPALALIQEIRKKWPETKIVAEIDDSVGEITPSSPHNWTDQHRWSAEHLYRSDAVICSTEYLANSVKPIIKDKPVHIAPNCINKTLWKFKKDSKKEKGIRIGYVGGGAHDEDLLIVYRSLIPILHRYPSVKFVIRYGGFKPKWFKDHPQVDFKCVAWNMDEYPQELSNMNLDLALAPLRDSEFNRCKSNLKWLEWASLNVPLLASNVEPYRKTAPKGGIILVDNNIELWKKAFHDIICKFLMGDNLDKLVVKNGKSLNKQHRINYNIIVETRKLLNFLENLIE